jgi:hypothetical protein
MIIINFMIINDNYVSKRVHIKLINLQKFSFFDQLAD